MSLLVEVRNGRVCRVKVMEPGTKERCIPEYPYCPEDDPTNKYASALRKRDYRISQGEEYEILELPSGDPEDLMLQKYENGNFIEDKYKNKAERKKDLAMSRATHTILPQGVSLIPDMNEINSKVGAGTFKKYLDKITNYEDFSNIELAAVEAKLNLFTEETRVKIIYQIANCLKAGICKNPGPNRKDNTIYWFSKLIGTYMEIPAWSAIAGIYVQHKEYEEALKIFKQLEVRDDLSDYERGLIEERIESLGVGYELIKEALEKKDKDPDKAIELIEEFEEKATGLCYLNGKDTALNAKGVCYGKIGRECKMPELIEYAKEMIKKNE